MLASKFPNGITGECQNSGDYSEANCLEWKEHCGGGEWRTFMEEHCSRTCGFCQTGGVSCGRHRAASCSECPEGKGKHGKIWHGAGWCNGECKWQTSTADCVLKEQSTIGNGNRWSSLLKSRSISSGNGNNFCNAIEGEFEAVTLINEINKERKRRGQSVIPAADDMCVTALMKGFTQKADRKYGATHDFSRTGVKDVLKMKRQTQWKFPVNLTPSGTRGAWRKPDEILGRSLQGDCYGCPQSSSGFENAHSGYAEGPGACDGQTNLAKTAVKGWIDSKKGHRELMFSEGTWRKHKWTRLGAAITSNCENKGTDRERFTYWANAWFSGKP